MIEYYSENADRSNYGYKIINGVIAIVDRDMGRMSVTNNIENIVGAICEKENLDLQKTPVVYLDSEQSWTVYQIEHDRFIDLGAMDEQLAVTTAKNYWE